MLGLKLATWLKLGINLFRWSRPKSGPYEELRYGRWWSNREAWERAAAAVLEEYPEMCDDGSTPEEMASKLGEFKQAVYLSELARFGIYCLDSSLWQDRLAF